MDQSNYSLILDTVSALLKEKGFNFVEDDGVSYYSNGQHAVRIEYAEESKQIALQHAVLTEGKGVDWKVASSWLFTEESTEKDQMSIANDFCDSILGFLGLKASAAVGGVDLPSKKKSVETIDIESFTARFLAIYPAYKETYKENVAKYGEFFYDAFFSQYGVTEFVTALKNGNKKQISKLFELFGTAYNKGDMTVTTTVVYTIICGALLKEPALEEDTFSYLEKYKFLKTACVNTLKLLKSTKGAKKYL